MFTVCMPDIAVTASRCQSGQVKCEPAESSDYVLAQRRAKAVSTVLNIGLISVVMSVLLSVAFGSTALTSEAPTWLLPIAIIALALGVPHGAVDQLILRRPLTFHQFLLFALGYVLVAGLAIAAIIAAPAPAFVVVLAGTVWHFGTGDVQATAELQGTPPEKGLARVVLALALGAAPVLLPLTSPASASTLSLIEPKLSQLVTPAAVFVVRGAVFIVISVGVVMLMRRRKHRAVLELLTLTALGCLASPLLAFAVYFGLWHAVRHTARLAQHTYGFVSLQTFGSIFRRGVPSIIGFIVVVGILVSRSSSLASSGTLLWFGLAIVWGLTVPHMILVTAFDRRMRSMSGSL
jgi:Brp/Blh family beta-carotene 15,15'-monooxygenase